MLMVVHRAASGRSAYAPMPKSISRSTPFFSITFAQSPSDSAPEHVCLPPTNAQTAPRHPKSYANQPPGLCLTAFWGKVARPVPASWRPTFGVTASDIRRHGVTASEVRRHGIRHSASEARRPTSGITASRPPDRQTIPIRQNGISQPLQARRAQPGSPCILL